MSTSSHGLLTAYRVFGPVDVKNIRREDLLMWIGGLMGVVVVLYRYGVPALAGVLDARLGFDLTPYYGFEEDVVHWHRTARDAGAGVVVAEVLGRRKALNTVPFAFGCAPRRHGIKAEGRRASPGRPPARRCAACAMSAPSATPDLWRGSLSKIAAGD